MPRYYLKFSSGGAAFVNKAGRAGAEQPTAPPLDGLTGPGPRRSARRALVNGAPETRCARRAFSRRAGSAFLANLERGGGDTVAGVSYTVIESAR